jgi:hypothetical protein
MTELEYYRAQLNWLGEMGKVTEADLAQFDKELRLRNEAKQFIADNFKGMF